MNDDARDVLRKVLAQYGSSLYEDPRRLRALLYDLCPDLKRETNVIIAALERRVPQELLNSSNTIPVSALCARLAQRWQRELPFDDEATRWAVNAWAVAVGKAAPDTTLRTPRGPSTPPNPEPSNPTKPPTARPYFPPAAIDRPAWVVAVAVVYLVLLSLGAVGLLITGAIHAAREASPVPLVAAVVYLLVVSIILGALTVVPLGQLRSKAFPRYVGVAPLLISTLCVIVLYTATAGTMIENLTVRMSRDTETTLAGLGVIGGFCILLGWPLGFGVTSLLRQDFRLNDRLYQSLVVASGLVILMGIPMHISAKRDGGFGAVPMLVIGIVIGSLSFAPAVCFLYFSNHRASLGLHSKQPLIRHRRFCIITGASLAVLTIIALLAMATDWTPAQSTRRAEVEPQRPQRAPDRITELPTKRESPPTVGEARLAIRLRGLDRTDTGNRGGYPWGQAQVAYVVPGGGGANMGLERRDLIVSVNGQPVRSTRRAIQAITETHLLGDALEVVVYRNGREVVLHGALRTTFDSAGEFHKVLALAGHDAEARYHLAYLYELGIGTQRAPASAFEHYLSAARDGHADAELRVGQLYMNGIGVAASDTEAASWLRAAGERGHAAAQSELGFLYLRGRGIGAADPFEAVRWFQQSAEQGDSYGQYNLGVCYQNGVGGLPQDPSEAERLYRLSAAEGNQLAIRALENLRTAEEKKN